MRSGKDKKENKSRIGTVESSYGKVELPFQTTELRKPTRKRNGGGNSPFPVIKKVYGTSLTTKKREGVRPAALKLAKNGEFHILGRGRRGDFGTKKAREARRAR